MPRRRRQSHALERVLGTPALFATAYGNVGSSIYYALGITASIALGLTPLVFVISGLIFAATALTYAEGTVRFPEAGGSASFARHAFNELASFGAGWAQMLNYIITIAISAFFVPHYLSIFWAPLKQNPWDIIFGALVIVLLALPPEQHGFQNDPVLGLVENLGIGGASLSVLKVYVGILAATILFIATNAGIIGASRITYSMATYRQLPEVFRRLHPRFKTPWLSLIVFAGFVSILVLLPGQTKFLGTMYSFGAMLSFTVAHASIVQLRRRYPDEELQFRSRPNLRIRGVDWPLFAVFGGTATGLAWLVVVVQSPGTRYAGIGWLLLGFLTY